METSDSEKEALTNVNPLNTCQDTNDWKKGPWKEFLKQVGNKNCQSQWRIFGYFFLLFFPLFLFFRLYTFFFSKTFQNS